MNTEYAQCPYCGRGTGISKNGVLRRHYRIHRNTMRKQFSKEICKGSGRNYKEKS